MSRLPNQYANELIVFGSCSGTEPIPGRKHVSFAFRCNDELYWFDAGEGCSYTAYTMGVDLLKCKAIFISHTHMDHIGGLGNLLWNIRKINSINGRYDGQTLELYLPDMRLYDALMNLLHLTQGQFSCEFTIQPRLISDGGIFENSVIRISAKHTQHLPHNEGDPWLAYGFLIEVGGKRIVYSGDTGGVDDFAELLNKCDLLLVETGHNQPVAMVIDMMKRQILPKQIAFIHHGLTILNGYDAVVRELSYLIPDRFVILNDGDRIDI